MAKMSFDETYLDQDCDDLTLTSDELSKLQGWIDKFTNSRQYPIVGRLILDKKLTKLRDRVLTPQDLALNDGSSSADIPEGYATQPIYVGVGNKVFDVSFSGVYFCGPKRWLGSLCWGGRFLGVGQNELCSGRHGEHKN
jgi:hypothetical protein